MGKCKPKTNKSSEFAKEIAPNVKQDNKKPKTKSCGCS
ncbi:hypothetical protein P22_3617 [Propionispora sp. 2/2-37]|nr:hypothetical protein P22_3617 [Propionispora sp. 2/2-37]